MLQAVLRHPEHRAGSAGGQKFRHYPGLAGFHRLGVTGFNPRNGQEDKHRSDENGFVHVEPVCYVHGLFYTLTINAPLPDRAS